MSLAPILAAPAMVKLHLAAATFALALAPIMWLRPKGDAPHKALGRLWAGAMAATAVSSFWVVELARGGFSLIHLLSVATLIGLPVAIWRARTGKIAAHRRVMAILTLSLIGAGLFTLLPSRILGRALFGL